MELQVVGANALTVSETTFGREFNEALIHQLLLLMQQVRVKVLVRKKLVLKCLVRVKNLGVKKGTGRARAGDIKSPIWRSGGTTFAAKPQDHSQKSEQENVPWCYQKHSF